VSEEVWIESTIVKRLACLNGNHGRISQALHKCLVTMYKGVCNKNYWLHDRRMKHYVLITCLSQNMRLFVASLNNVWFNSNDLNNKIHGKLFFFRFFLFFTVIKFRRKNHHYRVLNGQFTALFGVISFWSHITFKICCSLKKIKVYQPLL